MERVAIHYQYRDGSNYKRSGAPAVFNNESGMSSDEVASILVGLFDDGRYFVAESLSLPLFYFDDCDQDPDIDHGFHELLYIERSDLPATDDRDVAQLLEDTKVASESGWIIADSRVF